MNKLALISLKLVRWTGWLLVPITLAFLVTGCGISGEYGFDRLFDEKTAVATHRMLHVPLMVLWLAHVLPATYLALQRWGWIKCPKS